MGLLDLWKKIDPIDGFLVSKLTGAKKKDSKKTSVNPNVPKEFQGNSGATRDYLSNIAAGKKAAVAVLQVERKYGLGAAGGSPAGDIASLNQPAPPAISSLLPGPTGTTAANGSSGFVESGLAAVGVKGKSSVYVIGGVIIGVPVLILIAKKMLKGKKK